MTASEYLFKVWNWNDIHPEGDELHAPSLDVAAAMVNDEIGTNEGYKMQQTLKGFQGRYYNEIVEANKKANNDLAAFSAIVEPLYAQYQAEIAEYEASKEKPEEGEDAPAEETPAE